MRICVTGGLGFIGRELIKALKDAKFSPKYEILCIDDISKLDLDAAGDLWFQDYKSMIKYKNYNILKEVDFIFHLGANSSTRATKEELMDSNYHFSLSLLSFAQTHGIPVVVASSASIYGARRVGNVVHPQTPYAYFKWAIDYSIGDKMHLNMPLGKVVSLRFHNVYGATETDKGGMASIVCKWMDNYFNGIQTNDLFNDSDKIIRDFVHIEDVVKSLICMMQYYVVNKSLPHHYTLDIGTGEGVSFEKVAKEIVKHTKGTIQYIINPYTEKDYQFFTQANITDFKEIYQSLYGHEFVPIGIESGIEKVFYEKKHIHLNRNTDTDSSALAGM